MVWKMDRILPVVVIARLVLDRRERTGSSSRSSLERSRTTILSLGIGCLPGTPRIAASFLLIVLVLTFGIRVVVELENAIGRDAILQEVGNFLVGLEQDFDKVRRKSGILLMIVQRCCQTLITNAGRAS